MGNAKVYGEGVSPRFLGAAVFPGPNDGPAIMSCCGGKKGGCHTSEAKHLKSRPTEAPRSHSCHPQFPRVLGNSDCAIAPLFPPGQMIGPAIMSCCGGKKGGCHAERSEASEIPPNQNTAEPTNLLLCSAQNDKGKAGC